MENPIAQVSFEKFYFSLEYGNQIYFPDVVESVLNLISSVIVYGIRYGLYDKWMLISARSIELGGRSICPFKKVVADLLGLRVDT